MKNNQIKKKFVKKIKTNLLSENFFFLNESFRYSDLLGYLNVLDENLKGKKFEELVIICDRSLLTYISHIYAFLSDRIWVPISAKTKENEILEIIDQLNHPLVLYLESINFKTIKKKYNCINLDNINFVDSVKKDLSFVKLREDIKAIFFTSGSTGKPKGVKLSLINILFNLINMEKIINAKCNDKFVDFHEVSFVISVPILVYCLYCGSSIVVGNNTDLLNLKRLYSKYKFTILITVPTLLKVINKSNYTPKMALSTLVTCGEPISKNLVFDLNKKHSVKNFFNFYGSTEVAPWILFADLKACLHSNLFEDEYAPAGKKMDFIKLTIHKNSKTLIATGPQVSSGYLNQKSKKFRKIGNYYSYDSGDIFVKKKSYYFCKGRVDHEFKRHGIRMNLLNLEYTYKKLLKIENLYIVFLKEKNKLFLITEKKINKNLEKIILEKLSKNKHPDQLIALSSMSKTSSGKISRKKLEEICAKKIY